MSESQTVPPNNLIRRRNPGLFGRVWIASPACTRLSISAGGSLRDVQELAGHSSLQTTQGYIQGDTDAKRKLVDMI